MEELRIQNLKGTLSGAAKRTVHDEQKIPIRELETVTVGRAIIVLHEDKAVDGFIVIDGELNPLVAGKKPEDYLD